MTMRLSLYYSVFILLVLAFGCFVGAAAQTLAFPGADGYGRFTTGGRGGRVIEVTNLQNNGPGSLRDALAEQGPRTIVFRISGTIELKADLLVTNGDFTIAGQTAPGDGICIKNYATVIRANNVIIRYLRFRPGDEKRQENDGLTAMGCRDVIIDHCSMSWAIDEVGSFYDNENFTLQWCILSESLNSSYHHKGEHGYGGIWGGSKASFHHNLLAHHSSRNPRFNGGRTRTDPEAELVDFRNNVIYNWGMHCAYGGEMGRQNVVANYFKPGLASKEKSRILELWDAKGEWYVADNVVEGNPAVSQDNWKGVEAKFGTVGKLDAPLPFMITKTEAPSDAFESVLRGAGAVLPRRDAVDERIVREARAGTTLHGNGIIDSQNDVGGWPELRTQPAPQDSDHDGMPDNWERVQGLNPLDPVDFASLGPGGYTNLEQYLNQIMK